MAALNIGLNANLLASKAAMNQGLGQVVAGAVRALEAADEAYLFLSGIAQADLAAMGFGDGTGTTSNEIGYLKSALAAIHDLNLILKGQTPVASQPQNYKQQLQYVTGTSG